MHSAIGLGFSYCILVVADGRESKVNFVCGFAYFFLTRTGFCFHLSDVELSNIFLQGHVARKLPHQRAVNIVIQIPLGIHEMT